MTCNASRHLDTGPAAETDRMATTVIKEAAIECRGVQLHRAIMSSSLHHGGVVFCSKRRCVNLLPLGLLHRNTVCLLLLLWWGNRLPLQRGLADPE